MLKKKSKQSEPVPQVKEKLNPLEILKRKRENMNKHSLVDVLTEELKDMGVAPFVPSEMQGHLNIDTEYLDLPQDITDTTSRELGQYLNAFTQQRMYMRTLIGWQQLWLEESKRNYYEASADIYRELTRTKLSETAKERELNSHEEVKPFFLEYKDHKRKLDLLTLNITSIEDAIFMISREVSRRTGDFNTESREHNVSRR